MREKGTYVADKKHKEWHLYDEAGQLTQTLLYRAGILLQGQN